MQENAGGRKFGSNITNQVGVGPELTLGKGSGVTGLNQFLKKNDSSQPKSETHTTPRVESRKDEINQKLKEDLVSFESHIKRLAKKYKENVWNVPSFLTARREATEPLAQALTVVESDLTPRPPVRTKRSVSAITATNTNAEPKTTPRRKEDGEPKPKPIRPTLNLKEANANRDTEGQPSSRRREDADTDDIHKSANWKDAYAPLAVGKQPKKRILRRRRKKRGEKGPAIGEDGDFCVASGSDDGDSDDNKAAKSNDAKGIVAAQDGALGGELPGREEHTLNALAKQPRDNMADKPLIIMGFEGCLGDVYKEHLFDDKPPRLYMRPGVLSAMKNLEENYQVVMFTHQSVERIEKILRYFKMGGVHFDGVYVFKNCCSECSKQPGDPHYGLHMHRVYSDFGIPYEDVHKRVLVVGSLDLDTSDISERTGSRLLYESNAAKPLLHSRVTPQFSSDFSYLPPCTILVPNPRSQENNSAMPMSVVNGFIHQCARSDDVSYGFTKITGVKKVQTKVFISLPSHLQVLSNLPDDRKKEAMGMCHRYAIITTDRKNEDRYEAALSPVKAKRSAIVVWNRLPPTKPGSAPAGTSK